MTLANQAGTSPPSTGGIRPPIRIQAPAPPPMIPPVSVPVPFPKGPVATKSPPPDNAWRSGTSNSM